MEPEQRPERSALIAWRDRLRHRAATWAPAARRAPSSPAAPPAMGVVDGLLFAWRAGASNSANPAPAAPDERLWAALLDATIPVESIAARNAGQRSLLPREAYRTIEAWTEADLSAMHALWWLARRRSTPRWNERVLDAAAWHVENIQPDNATNRPWALHVFLDLWRATGSPEARLHAETLLHNADAAAGDRDSGPGALIAAIVADSADALDELLNEG